MDFVQVAHISEIKPGGIKTVNVQGKMIALANVDGKFFAIDDTCSHNQCSLGTEGFLDGSAVTCGCHGAQFDVCSGSVLMPPASVRLSSYEVKVDGNDILVQV